MRGFLIALFVLGAAGAAAAAEFSTLEEKMSTQEFRAAAGRAPAGARLLQRSTCFRRPIRA